ncbi:MAG: DUF2950 family protein [Planctomycetes bacterium]|jgi:prepilin-type N-terminal cleavage/methylation domain-containing protein|nr:DUF2950 family protein [Planctomycetota bacterium]
MRSVRGFTLLELMIVIAVIAIIAAIAIPNLLAARLNANEDSAIATLRNLISAQSQFQCMAKADVNLDGTGEFGGFLELTGAGDVREDPLIGPIRTPVMSGGFRRVTTGGYTVRSGYYFMILLPGPTGAGVCLDSAAVTPDAVDPRLSASFWCCYAWPETYGSSGRRTFLINQSGDIVFTEHANYTGGEDPAPMPPGAGFLPPGGGETDLIDGLLAVGETGCDGNLWREVD